VHRQFACRMSSCTTFAFSPFAVNIVEKLPNPGICRI
jgi:hypothetical protein